jgi:hypothetical protein
MEQKNKGGRPTKAEVAARGVTKTEFEAGLKILKKIYGQSLSRKMNEKELNMSEDNKPNRIKNFLLR